MNLGTIKNVEIIEKNISDGVYDYILTTPPANNSPFKFGWSFSVEYVGDFSIINVVENENEIDFDKDGWNIWIVKYPDKESIKNGKDCLFIQIANGEWGCDHHVLTEYEINSLVDFFVNKDYKINKQ